MHINAGEDNRNMEAINGGIFFDDFTFYLFCFVNKMKNLTNTLHTHIEQCFQSLKLVCKEDIHQSFSSFVNKTFNHDNNMF